MVKKVENKKTSPPPKGNSGKAEKRAEPDWKEKMTILPSRVGRLIRKRAGKTKVALATTYALSAVLGYLASELFETSAVITDLKKRTTIYARDLMLAVRDDRELDSLYRNVQFADVGTTNTRNLDRALMNDSQLKRLAAKNFAAAAGALPSTTSKTAAAAPKPLKK